MSSRALFVRLQRLTGRLSASPDAPADELTRFERILAEYLHANPDLVIRGNRLPLDALDDQSDLAASFEARISRLEEMLARPASAETAASPLIFPARDGVSIEPARQLRSRLGSRCGAGGQFRTVSRRERAEDLVRSVPAEIKLVTFYLAGLSAPILRVPVRGLLTGRQSYRIEAGSAWIA